MKALTSRDVAALHTLAVRRGDLNPADRAALADIARTGTIGAKYKTDPGAKRVAKLRKLGYLPAATA